MMNTSSPTMTRLFSWRNWLSPRGKESRTPAGPTREMIGEAPIPLKAHRILVVDDDEVVRKATELRLKSHGYVVTTAADGPAAIHAARTEQPDLILLDFDFPTDVSLTWDGFRIMTWLQRMECTRNTPIIMITATSDESVAERAHELGAAGFFRKPMDYSALLILIDRRLKEQVPPRTNSTGDSACEI